MQVQNFTSWNDAGWIGKVEQSHTAGDQAWAAWGVILDNMTLRPTTEGQFFDVTTTMRSLQEV